MQSPFLTKYLRDLSRRLPHKMHEELPEQGGRSSGGSAHKERTLEILYRTQQIT